MLNATAAAIPGLLLCALIAVIAALLQNVEVYSTGQAYLEALVLAIIVGLLVRAVWEPGLIWQPGVHFAAKVLLEAAVVLLGAAVSIRTVLRLGAPLLAGIMLVVAVAIVTSYSICRALALQPRMALLIACGNAICGNSAIAAVAPVIGAKAEDITASIAFTAVLGVVVVLLLPLLVPLLALSLTQYGVLAGLTVYAVPQVLAATLPIGALSNQVGTVVKLVRVLMLGPVILTLSMVFRRGTRPKLTELVPWFIIGFLAVLMLRSLGIIPVAFLSPVKNIAAALTTVSMAALGLGVDLRTVARTGLRVSTAVTLSLMVLCAISLALIHMLHV